MCFFVEYLTEDGRNKVETGRLLHNFIFLHLIILQLLQ